MRRQVVTAQVEQKIRILDYASDAKQLLKTIYIYCLLQLGVPVGTPISGIHCEHDDGGGRTK
jgi:hypothetical protein